MIYKCPNCGYALKFDPTAKKLVCDACISFFDFDDVSKDIEGKSDEAEELAATAEAVDIKSADTEALDDDYMECNIYSCTSCGGELMVNGLESSTFCAYCGQPTIVFNRVSRELKPQYIIPFSVTKEEAITTIREKLNAGFFVPDEIKNFETERIKGIYIPYWLCDMNYSDEQTLKGTVGSGKHAKTRYFYRAAKANYRDITLDASHRLSDETSQRLEPYYMNDRVTFNTGYMTGYYADRYDVDQEEIKGVAISRAASLFNNEIKKSIDANKIQILECKPEIQINKLKYALLPAWFLTFRYEGEAYTFLVNGQTKKVVGGVPVYKKTIIFLIILISAVLTMILTPLIIKLLEFDTDAAGDFIGLFLCLGGAGFTATTRNVKKIKKSIELTKSRVMLNFVKERQEGD